MVRTLSHLFAGAFSIRLGPCHRGRERRSLHNDGVYREPLHLFLLFNFTPHLQDICTAHKEHPACSSWETEQELVKDKVLSLLFLVILLGANKALTRFVITLARGSEGHCGQGLPLIMRFCKPEQARTLSSFILVLL